MATLEKIRSKSVLLLIIIAVALLAFILGDFFTSGRTFFGTGTTVAKVDGEKIDIMEFQQRLNEASENARRQGQNVDGAVLQQQVLEGMIAEKLYKRELEELGITVTDQELSDAMLGAGAAYLDRMVQQQYGLESAAQLHDMAYNPAKYQLDESQAQQLRQVWVSLEKNVEEQLLQGKFQTLFAGTLVANNLDAKALYDENVSTSRVAFAKTDYASLDDKDYEVTEADVKTVYNEQRNRFRLDEPTRMVSYVAVEIQPSVDDLRKGSAKVDAALAGLASEEGTAGLEGMNEFVVTRETSTRANLDAAIKSFVDSASVGSSRQVSHVGNTYTLAKLLGRTTQVDSVNIDIINIHGTLAEADSTIAALRSGKPFSEVAAGSNVEASHDSLWLSLTNPQAAQLREVLDNAVAGSWFTPDSVGEYYRIMRLNTRRAPVTVYDVAKAVYVVEPGAATINKLEGDLSRFVKENTTAEAFEKNAEAAGYTLLNATVTPSSARLGNLNDSREAVAWVMEASKGQVSPVIGNESSGRFIAVALDRIYEDDFVPMNDPDLYKQLEATARNNKKAAAIIEKYAGKANDLTGYAALMGAQVDTTTVNFGQIFIPKVGVGESEFTAAATAAKPGKVVGPIKGKSGVIVFEVTGIDNSGRPFNVEESSMQFTQSRGAGNLGRQINSILRGNKKVENKSLNFYNR